MTWKIEQSQLGRIAIPGNVPDGAVLFCTSSDFEGRLTSSNVESLCRLLRGRFGFDAGLASCGQIHGARVASAPGESNAWSETPDCDALVSEDRAVALVIKIADCLPVSILDSESGAVANVHSGWRGVAARIVPATLESMSKRHSTNPPAIQAWLGPSIRVCCFEVGEEVVDALTAAWGDIGDFVDRSLGTRPHVDLAGLTTSALVSAGVPESAVDDSEICTRCEGSIFHSFRRDKEASGRNLMVIGRK